MPDLVVSPASPRCETPTKEYAFETVMVSSPPTRKGIQYESRNVVYIIMTDLIDWIKRVSWCSRDICKNGLGVRVNRSAFQSCVESNFAFALVLLYCAL